MQLSSEIFLIIALVNNFFASSAAQLRGTKRKCYQCNMPFECTSGMCIGDLCVKSLASDQYVSKGCENRTSRSISGESYYGDEAMMRAEESRCVTETMFGVNNVICYCADMDFCNRSSILYTNNYQVRILLLSNVLLNFILIYVL
uniref:Protein sleepless n=1 Tax=Parascaris univalens TaxID=6257 RepID=A0A915B500_PARUN